MVGPSRGVVEVWSTLLEVTADSATKRKKMADEVLEKAADDIKQYKKMKDGIFRKVHSCVQEIVHSIWMIHAIGMLCMQYFNSLFPFPH